MPNRNDTAAPPTQLSTTLKQQILDLCEGDDADAGSILRAVINANPALVSSVVEGLPAEQKQAAAAAAAAEVPNEATPGLVATVVQGLPTQQKREAAQAAMSTLSHDQRGELAASILGEPNPKTQQRLWYLVVGTMGLSIFVFGFMSFLLINWGKASDAPLALATTALGGVVGLVASGPGRGRR